ncbi:carbohydrate-binding protein [uncultured Aquimarina sp.]|uniref:carbohydrate-binding protein n=1 Tax=uncultured Aquimarina sp. TaxID=575652 RepID=UPI002631642E|nr:carbohydrate-binding protein [uncultured Aquimarina sp.]
MITNNKLIDVFKKNNLISRTKTLVLLVFLILCSDIGKAQQTSEAPWMEGSWGVRLIIRGGKDLDRYVANGYDYVEAAKQIVRDYPTIGHVITNLTNNANSSLYTVRQNNYIDVANEIHPDFVPSLENEQIIFDVIKVFKDAGIKVILYINHWPNMGEGSAAQIAGWDAYKNRNNLGNYPAFNLLMRGFLERFDGLVDGYWIDKIGGSDDSIPRKDIFINVIKETNPGAALGVNFNKSYFPGIKVDSDGVNERDEDDYKIIKYQANDIWSQFTAGHVTSIGGQKAPSNSWGYEEYTVTDMEESPLSVHPETGKVFVKHMFAPIRRRWSLNDEPLMYDKDQAYRMVKRITSAGASITFSTTITNGGLAMPDEVEVLKHVNDQLEANADYVPYTRPEQAYLVGETRPNYHQFIDFREIPNKKVGDPDFSPFAHASSGASVTLSSSNNNVATIVNNKIRIKGLGTTNITASQGGNNTFAAAASKMRQLTITTDDGGTDPDETNLALQGAATQSSNHPNGGGEAFLAIDGNTNGKWSGGSVTRTSSEIDPWWQVDLGSNHTIDDINVFARIDNCCNTRLSNFDVIVMDSNGAITYTKTYTTYPDPSITMDVGGVTGQIIKIQQHSDSTAIVLNLAEVEVYGSEVSACTTIEAEDYDTMSGIMIESSSDTGGGQQVGFIQNGDWLRFNNIDLSCANAINARVSSKNNGGDIEVRLNGISGTLITTIPVDTTGSWTNYETVSAALNAVSGTHDVYLVFTGGNGYLFNLNWIEFNGSTSESTNTIIIEENEMGFCNVDGSIKSVSKGYTGIGYANTSNAIGKAIDWEIDGAAGSYTFVWRYYGGSARTADLIVNGTTMANDMLFIDTQDNWITMSTTVTLDAGVKSISLNATSNQGLAKIDYVEVTGPDLIVSGCTNLIRTSPELEASDAEGVLYAFPNPVTDILTINNNGSKTANLKIINSLGQQVLSQNMEEANVTVDLSNLNSGIYIIKVTDVKQVRTKKIFKK